MRMNLERVASAVRDDVMQDTIDADLYRSGLTRLSAAGLGVAGAGEDISQTIARRLRSISVA